MRRRVPSCVIVQIVTFDLPPKASKRNSSSGAPAPAARAHYNDQGVRERWPALIYCLQSHRGWEVYSDPDKEATTTTVTAAAPAGKNTNAAAHKAIKGGGSNVNGSSSLNVSVCTETSSTEPRGVVEELTTAPRQGCNHTRK